MDTSMFHTRIFPLAFTAAIALNSIVIILNAATQDPDDLRKQLNAIADGFDGKLGL